MHKRFTIVPRGTGLVLGCCTFPTWNGYPGLFAGPRDGQRRRSSSRTPARSCRSPSPCELRATFCARPAFDPNVVTLLATEPNDGRARSRASRVRPEIKLIDFTGSTQNGTWLERNAHQAQVYTEKAGVNQIVIDSVDDMKAVRPQHRVLARALFWRRCAPRLKISTFRAAASVLQRGPADASTTVAQALARRRAKTRRRPGSRSRTARRHPKRRRDPAQSPKRRKLGRRVLVESQALEPSVPSPTPACARR